MLYVCIYIFFPFQNGHKQKTYILSCFSIHLKICLLDLEREEGRKRERETHRCERETLIGCLPYAP